LSGTYQQVLPRYVSVDTDGVEREFLYDALGTESLGLIFLKGYQWPFDTRKMDGSSRVDLLVADETRRGRRVYLDFTRNPKGLEDGFSVLPEEAYTYLSRSGALFGTPIERLAHMNRRAVALYADHGIDLATEWLPIAVCAQHCNGGVAIDAHWQSDVRGLYVTGEAAGNFGVYRPGGSALNATQVGSLRAAEHIAAQYDAAAVANGVAYTPIPIRRGENNLDSIRAEVQGEMSRVADFSRDTGAMEALLARVSYLCDHLFEIACVSETREIADWYRLRDMLLTVREVLSAMLCSAREIGSHGASYIVGDDRIAPDAPRRTRTLTRGGLSRIEPVMPIPDAELWFETLLARLTFHGDESVTQRCQDETIRNR
jgi:succinate dehydrogenase/fumarate reductase flavoprotein subunit